MEERSDDEVFKIENKGLVNENEENECVVEGQSVCDKNGLIIATIVYQCVDCVTICHTISEANQHYTASHTKSDALREQMKTNNGQSLPNECLNEVIVEKVCIKFAKIKRNNKTKQLQKIDQNSEISLLSHEKVSSDDRLEPSSNSTTIGAKSSKKRKRKYTKTERGLYKIIGKQFLCDECGKSYSTPKILRTHKRIHSDPVKCDYPDCERQFPFRSLMKMHYRVHTNEYRFRCDWPGCDYATVHQAGILAHKRTHTGERPYKCVWPGCAETFCQQSSLNSHISYRHDKEAVKRIKCEWPGCDMSFLFANELRKHHRSHTGERPYHCDWPLCGQSFATTTVLKRHKVTHTGERAYRCDWPGCEARFGASGTLNTHKKLVHKCDYIKRSRWDNKKKKS